MDSGPEELRRQRDLVARHLAWLDTKIAEAEGTPAPADAVAPQATAQSSPHAPPPTTVNPESTPAAPELLGEDYRSSTADQIRSAKVGCVLLTVGAIALFVFVLFGLPYLLD